MPRTVLDRFWEKVDLRGPDECWGWNAAKSLGYGAFGWGIEGRKVLVKAHRFSYELHTGECLTPDIVVCHRCDNPACVNPAHLTPGTQADNVRDCKAKGRNSWGERNGQHKLTESDVLAIRLSDRPQRELARKYGVAQSTVSRVRAGLRWEAL